MDGLSSIFPTISPPLAFGLAFVAVFVVLLGVALARERRRSRSVVSVGLGLGLGFERRGPGLETELRALPSIAERPRNSFSHVLRSPDELLCDWSIALPSEKRTRRQMQTLYAQRAAGAALPRFRLVSSVGSRPAPGDRAAGRKVDFPDDPQFENRFSIEGEDAEAVRSFFDTERRARLEVPEEIVVEAGGEWLACYVPRRRIRPDEWMAFRERARVIVDRIRG